MRRGYLTEIENQVLAMAGGQLGIADVHALLLQLEAELGRPYAVFGPGARFRWQVAEHLMVEVGIHRVRDGGLHLTFSAFDPATKVDVEEYRAFEYGELEDYPYFWMLELGKAVPGTWFTGSAQLASWRDFADVMGSVLASFPTDLAAIPPAWFDQRIDLLYDLGDQLLWIMPTREGLRIEYDTVVVNLTPTQAAANGRRIGEVVAAQFGSHDPAQTPMRRVPFLQFPTPGGDDTSAEPVEPAALLDLAALPEPTSGPRKPVHSGSYSDVGQSAQLIGELLSSWPDWRSVLQARGAELTRESYVFQTYRLPSGARANASTRGKRSTCRVTLAEVDGPHSADQLEFGRQLIAALHAMLGPVAAGSASSDGALEREWTTPALTLRLRTGRAHVQVTLNSV